MNRRQQYSQWKGNFRITSKTKADDKTPPMSFLKRSYISCKRNLVSKYVSLAYKTAEFPKI